MMFFKSLSKNSKINFFTIVATFATTITTPVFAADGIQVERRSVVVRDAPVDNRMAANNPNSNSPSNSGSGMWELYSELEILREEVLQLRGFVEQQRYQIDQLQKQTTQRYIDLDHRVVELEGGDSAGSSALSNGVDVGSASVATSSASASAEFKKRYEAAQDAIRARKYSEAKQILESLIQDDPKGEYAPFAHYWLAELMLAAQPVDMDGAAIHFKEVIDNHPQHGRVPASLYKLGTILDSRGEKGPAREMLTRLVEQYPDSSDARKASQYLQQMR